MKTISLNGEWKMRIVGTEDWVHAKVPGSVYNDLIPPGFCPTVLAG
jgi:hypothetical protein